MIWLLLHLACSFRYEGELKDDCNDGADNDKDGLFDCKDDGCTNSPICIEAKLKIYDEEELILKGDTYYHKNLDKIFEGKARINRFGEGNIKEGKLNGTWTSWYEDGQKCWEKNYKDGKKHGTHTIWEENGEIRFQMTYINGVLQD